MEEGELSEDPDCTTNEPDQAVSEEQTYRMAMSGIRSYMGWSNIPDLDSATTGSDDNPFSGPKSSTPGKVSVQMTMEEWLCKKLSKLNVTLVEGYPSRSSEAGGSVTNVKLAATNLPVGARLQNFWQTWLDLGAGPKVVQILKEG